MTAPFILMCAPNGARKTHSDHPALPISPGELADCAESVVEAVAIKNGRFIKDDIVGGTIFAAGIASTIYLITKSAIQVPIYVIGIDL